MAGVIIGSIAFVVAIMALPTVLQMMCGRPRIRLDLGLDKIDSGIALQCTIWNEPITNKLLRALRVRRMVAEDVTAVFDIKRLGGEGNIYSKYLPKIRDHSGKYAQRVSFPCSPISASFGIAFKRGNEPAKLFSEGTDIVLDVGKY